MKLIKMWLKQATTLVSTWSHGRDIKDITELKSVICHWKFIGRRPERSDQFAGYFVDQFAGFYTDLFSNRRPDWSIKFIHCLTHTKPTSLPVALSNCFQLIADQFSNPIIGQFTGLFIDQYATYLTDPASKNYWQTVGPSPLRGCPSGPIVSTKARWRPVTDTPTFCMCGIFG